MEIQSAITKRAVLTRQRMLWNELIIYHKEKRERERRVLTFKQWSWCVWTYSSFKISSTSN